MCVKKFDQNAFWKNISNSDFTVMVGDHVRKIVLGMADPQPGKVVLDAGCGTGRMARFCAEKGALVIGVDSAQDMLRVAREQEERQLAGVQYHEIDITSDAMITNLDLTKQVDTIICNSVLMHCDPFAVRRFFYHTMQLLRPGGTVVVSVVPHPDLIKIARNGKSQWIDYNLQSNTLDDVIWRGKPARQTYRNGQTGKVHTSSVYVHKESFFESVFSEAGFSNVEMRVVAISEQMLCCAGFPPGDPTLGINGYTIVTGVKQE